MPLKPHRQTDVSLSIVAIWTCNWVISRPFSALSNQRLGLAAIQVRDGEGDLAEEPVTDADSQLPPGDSDSLEHGNARRPC